MTLPERTFSADEGQRSTGTAGPDQIEYDLDNLFASLNPDATLKNGAPGGIGPENLRTFYVDPDQAPTGNIGKPTDFLSWFANRLRELIGDENWYDDPPIALFDIKQHVESVDGVHGADPGEVLLNTGNLVGGTGITVTKHDGVVTLTATGGQTPAKHASNHSAGGSDPLTGYALESHQHSGADVTSPVANATNATNASQAATAGFATNAGNAANANYAATAGFATNAGNAANANYATTAGSADTAGNADTVDNKHATDFAEAVATVNGKRAGYAVYAP